MMTIRGGAIAVGLCALLMASPASAKLKPVLVDRSPSGEKANVGSDSPAISADGRYIAFTSYANNLDAADIDDTADVYVRDIDAGTTTLVSRASGFDAASADDHAVTPAISADGRFVAFVSAASNLAPGLPEGSTHVYVRDLVAQSTTLVSRGSGQNGAPGSGASASPSISADGRYVAFASGGIIGAGAGAGLSIYVRDLTEHTTTLVSRANGAEGAPGNDLSQQPLISADGANVAFTSFASNLASGHPGPTGSDATSAYIRDLVANRTALGARSSGGAPADRDADALALSANGGQLAFASDSTNLVKGKTGPRGDFYSRDLASGRTEILSRGLPAPDRLRRRLPGSLAASASGRRLVFAYMFEKQDLTGERQYVFTRDLSGKTTRIAGLLQRRQGGIDEFRLSLSADGRQLAFRTTQRLHPDDNDDDANIYLVKLPT